MRTAVRGFSYKPLEDGHLRLLELEWKEGEKSPHVTISSYSMRDHPPFEALSYAWGDPETASPMVCNAGVIYLSSNLSAALHRIISPGGKRTMWIDQMCIDQSNNVEKGVQVALMGKIFSTAERVIVWLGDAPVTSKPGFDSLPMLMDSLQELVRKGENYEVFNASMLEKFGLPDQYHSVWGVLWEVLNSAWFRRLWVMQEATLAKDLRLYYGANSVEWNFIKDLARSIRDVASVYRLNPYVKISSRQDAFWNLEIIRYLRESRNYENLITLSDLLEFSSGKNCTLEEDKIYALFGILKEEEQDKLVIDYEKPIQQIHLEAFRVAMETDPTLSLLNLPFTRDRSSGLPSWCPVLESRIEAFRLRRDLYAGGCVEEPFHYGHPRFSTDSRTVTLKGLHLGTIQNVVSTPHPSRDVYEEEGADVYSKESLKFEEHCFDVAASTLEGKARLTLEPHWRTLTADATGYQGGRAKLDMGEAYEVWKKALIENKSIGANGEVKAGQYIEFHGAMLNACGGRRYFNTDNGRLGLGPDDCQAGDVVVLFLGGHTPFVIRRNDGKATYSFIGESYVQGLMDGEALELLEDEELQVQDFVLD